MLAEGCRISANDRDWVEEHPASEPNGITQHTNPDDPLRILARQIIDERERRNWFFPKATFGESAWEMLLLLYTSDTHSLSSQILFNATLSTPTLGERWLDFLQDEGLIMKIDGFLEEARGSVALTPKALHALELYLSDRLHRTQRGNGPSRNSGWSVPASVFRKAKVPAAVAAAVLAGAILCLSACWRQ